MWHLTQGLFDPKPRLPVIPLCVIEKLVTIMKWCCRCWKQSPRKFVNFAEPHSTIQATRGCNISKRDLGATIIQMVKCYSCKIMRQNFANEFPCCRCHSTGAILSWHAVYCICITKSPDGKFGKRGNGVAWDTLMIFSEELRISILYPVKCVTDTLGSDSFSSLQNYSLIAIPREMPLLRNFPYLRLRGHGEKW